MISLQLFSTSILQVEPFLHSLPLLNIYVMSFFLQHFLWLLAWLCFTSPAPGCTSHLYLICSSALLLEHHYSLQSSVKSLVLITLCCVFQMSCETILRQLICIWFQVIPQFLWSLPSVSIDVDLAHLSLWNQRQGVFFILPNRHPLCCHTTTHCFFSPSVFLYFRAKSTFLNL